jgi:hypothetical protein
LGARITDRIRARRLGTLMLTGLHQGAKGHSNCSGCVGMYIGPMRTAWGDKRLDANCCLYVGVQPLIPQAVRRVYITVQRL